MKLPKSLWYVCGVLVALVLIVPLFLPVSLRVHRMVVVNAPLDQVFSLVADLERHPEWHPWDITDSLPRLVFGEKRHGVDASYFWIGNRDNHGMLKWTAVEPEEHRIDGLLDLSSMGESEISFVFTPTSHGVEVREEFRKVSGHNLRMRYLKPLYRARVAEQLDGNLARLKRTAEAFVRASSDAARADSAAASEEGSPQ